MDRGTVVLSHIKIGKTLEFRQSTWEVRWLYPGGGKGDWFGHYSRQTLDDAGWKAVKVKPMYMENK